MQRRRLPVFPKTPTVPSALALSARLPRDPDSAAVCLSALFGGCPASTRPSPVGGSPPWKPKNRMGTKVIRVRHYREYHEGCSARARGSLCQQLRRFSNFDNELAHELIESDRVTKRAEPSSFSSSLS